MEQDRSGFRTRLTDHLPVAVTTTLGLFLVSDGVADGPYLKGHRVTAFLQSGSAYLAATVGQGGEVAIWSSDDDGQSWSEHALGASDIESGPGPRQVLQLQHDAGAPSAAAVRPFYVGIEPAGMLRSVDGTCFDQVGTLEDNFDRTGWESKAGEGINTVLTHVDRPGRIIVAAGGAGVYRSDDGGGTWQARNGGIAMRSVDGTDLAARHVYKVAFDASGPDCVFAQTDTGTYRSDSAGDSWTSVGRSGEVGGLPSDFGYAVAGHPIVPGTAYVFPLESKAYPCNPGGRPRVYRTTDCGLSWEALGVGLPAVNAHLTVLPDALAIGPTSPFPIVFGTTSGQLFASVDQGEEWRLVASGLPPVLCIRVLD